MIIFVSILYGTISIIKLISSIPYQIIQNIIVHKITMLIKHWIKRWKICYKTWIFNNNKLILENT